MKRSYLKLLTILAVVLFTSSAVADKVIAYDGYRGYYGGHRGHYPGHGYRPGGWQGKYCHHNLPRYRSNYYDYKHGYRHNKPRYYSGHHYDRRHYIRQRHNQSQYSYTPVLAGGIIGGVIGAEIGGSDPAALGGAVLGASIGRDFALRHGHRH